MAHLKDYIILVRKSVARPGERTAHFNIGVTIDNEIPWQRIREDQVSIDEVGRVVLFVLRVVHHNAVLELSQGGVALGDVVGMVAAASKPGFSGSRGGISRRGATVCFSATSLQVASEYLDLVGVMVFGVDFLPRSTLGSRISNAQSLMFS